MPDTVPHPDPQCKPAEYLTLPQLEPILASQVIQEVLTECEAWEQCVKISRISVPSALCVADGM